MNTQITEAALDQIYKLVYDFDETEADNTPRLLALLGEVRGIAWTAKNSLPKGKCWAVCNEIQIHDRDDDSVNCGTKFE